MSEETESIGPIVGPVSGTVGGASGSAAQYTGYDVSLGGLPFMLAPSDDRPYARETADFRKQQVDTTSTVGDQSLTGFWTRGQLSFHRGAGIKFYETLDGETVLNRFSDSLGVDPWTPGQVTLRAPDSRINTTSSADVILHDGALGVLSQTGAVSKITYTGTATALASSDGNPFSSIASDGVNLYGANATKLEKRAPSGSFAVLWTLTTGGRTISQVFWAKSRLWVVDSAGEWYTLSTAGGTFATGDANSLWKSPHTGAWSLADSEGSVFMANRNRIFSSTIDASTATPVLGAPVQVASVGAQETIGAIGSYLGYLTVASSAGVRIARVGDGLLLGDLIYKADASNCNRLSYRESLILVTSAVSSSVTLSEVNPLEQVSDLQGAYAPVRSLGTVTGKHGSFVLADGRVGYFGSGGIYLEDAALGSAVGTITTGFHRFGTLEPKDFRTVTVRASGTGGSIAVSLVTRDGVEHSLVTLGPTNFYENEISLNLDSPTDYIGLKFTITAESGVAPTFLGYQLRALPAPKRQRLIQIPLACFDTEKVDRSQKGHRGWAWERLKALESMEEESGAVRYQNFLLKESATVLIEKIQFQSTTPQTADRNGFGGYIVVTLRKVA